MSAPHRMNPNWGAPSKEGPSSSAKKHEEPARSEHDTMPHIHMHPHNNGTGKVSVHIMHHGGKHEVHVHEGHDTAGMNDHLQEHYGQQEGGPLEADVTPAAENMPEQAL